MEQTPIPPPPAPRRCCTHTHHQTHPAHDPPAGTRRCCTPLAAPPRPRPAAGTSAACTPPPSSRAPAGVQGGGGGGRGGIAGDQARGAPPVDGWSGGDGGGGFVGQVGQQGLAFIPSPHFTPTPPHLSAPCLPTHPTPALSAPPPTPPHTLRSARCISSRLYLATAASPLLPSSSCRQAGRQGGGGAAMRTAGIRAPPKGSTAAGLWVVAPAPPQVSATGNGDTRPPLPRNNKASVKAAESCPPSPPSPPPLHLRAVGAAPRVGGQRVDALTAVELVGKVCEAVGVALRLGHTLQVAGGGGGPGGDGAAGQGRQGDPSCLGRCTSRRLCM